MTERLRVHHNATAQRIIVKITRVTLILPSLPLECLTAKHYFSGSVSKPLAVAVFHRVASQRELL